MIKIVVAIFEKIQILIYVNGKTKSARNIYKRTRDIEFELDMSIGLGSMFGDSHTDRQIVTDIFLKHFFRMRE